MATPRSLLVDPKQPMHYHLVSRCVRRAWLCGFDAFTGRDYSHRQQWLEQHLLTLSAAFSVELHGYAVMSNHLHLVVFYDPLASLRWSDEEVVERWFHAHPLTGSGAGDDKKLARRKQAMAEDPQKVAHCRNHLGSLSQFMKTLKQPIAARANREDDVNGHFFEQRFYSGALLDENALLTAMSYVDLNPVKAELSKDIAESDYTAIAHRLKVIANTPERIDEYLAPIVSGLEKFGDNSAPQVTSRRPCSNAPAMTLRDYIDRLYEIRKAARNELTSSTGSSLRFNENHKTFGIRQRVYGSVELIQAWISERQFRPKEIPLV